MTVLIAVPLVAQGRGPGFGNGPGTGLAPGSCQNLAALPVQALSEAENNSILYMREEEKLARDVYRGLFQKWGTGIFARIATSEQRHMDAIKALITRYQLTDPVSDDTPGVFTNKGLLALYNELINDGLSSEKNALRVGARIEDLDIHDLEKALKEADNEDVKLVYGNLSRASGNHLRAFTGQLEAIGETYTPEFLSAAEYDEIVNSPVQPGQGRGNGRGWRRGRQIGPVDGNAAPRCLQN
jgi:hypothetical protein